MVTGQLVQLSGKLPSYRNTLVAKVRDIRGQTGGTLQTATETIEEIGEELMAGKESGGGRRPSARQSGLGSSARARGTADDPAVAVKVVEMPPSPLSQVRQWLGPFVAPLSTAGIVTVLVVFMLIQREQLRNRFIELLGPSNLHATTEAIADATDRISRYLQMALLINMGYGLAVGVGLYLIGVPNALLWGVLGMLLRFLPYLGPWLAAVMPIFLALAVFDGWSSPLQTIGLFVVLELLVNNVFEPLLYGNRLGISSMGVILAAIFWTWIWGPVGLVVAVPLTVCVVIAGNYVPQLQFLSILLGDRPALSMPERIYQRMLAQDDDEVGRLAAECVENTSPEEFHEGVLIPVLAMIERDRHAGRLSDRQERFAIETSRELAEESSVREAASRPSPGDSADRLSPRGRVLCIPAGDEADAIVAQMLGRILARDGFQYSSGSPDLLTSEFVQRVREDQCDMVIISAVPPLATRKARYLCKRLRQHHPDLPVLIGLWNGRAQVAGQEWLLGLGATSVVNSLSEAVAEARRIIATRLSPSAAVGPAPQARPRNSLTV